MTMPGNGNPAPGPAVGQPHIGILAQYIKDFSFENPNAPRAMAELKQQPSINVQINVNSRLLANTDYEVELKIEGKAEAPGMIIFAFDLLYAGVFRFENFPPDNIQPVVMIECPRLLFPFAREIVASTVTSGGFPPLLLDPVDFASLYQQRMAQVASQPTPAQG
jgi:preprotein translocase subunit SecB